MTFFYFNAKIVRLNEIYAMTTNDRRVAVMLLELRPVALPVAP